MRELFFILAASALLVAGCATPPSDRSGDGDAAKETPDGSDEAPSEAKSDDDGDEEKAQATDPGAREMVTQARRASRQGEHERAARLLERALRIAPRDAAIWQNLAVVRYRQKRYDEAETLAQRSNRLAGDDGELRRRNWALIAAARDKLGNAKGARKARERRRELSPQDASL